MENKKSKDPAFLFYSKDFYEGTRTMLPEERACYIDLMIYQHQHGSIPTDLKRVLLYCNGIDEATLIATLNAKFTLCDTGWVNETLQNVMNERKTFSENQAINGTVGNFFKKAKSILKLKEYIELKELLNKQSNNSIYNQIIDKEINEAMLIAMRDALRTHLANENVNEDINKNDNIVIKSENLLKFENWLKENAPTVLKMDIQFNDENLQKLKEKHKINDIQDILIAMHNYKPLLSKNKDAYLTANNWINKRKTTPNYSGKDNRSILQIYKDMKPYEDKLTGELFNGKQGNIDKFI